MTTENDLYKILGVSRTATLKQINAAYRNVSAMYHPDKSKDSHAHEKMQKINAAIEVLRSPERRKFYDATGCTSERDWQGQPAHSASESKESTDDGGYCASCGNNHAGDCGSDFNFRPAGSKYSWQKPQTQCCSCDAPEENKKHFLLPCGFCYWCHECACRAFEEDYDRALVGCECDMQHIVHLEQVKEFISRSLYEQCAHILRPICSHCGTETTLMRIPCCQHSWCKRCMINQFSRAIRPPGCCGRDIPYGSAEPHLPAAVARLYQLKKESRFRQWEAPDIWPKDKAAEQAWMDQNPSAVFGPEAAGLLASRDEQIKELRDKLTEKDAVSDPTVTKARISELQAETQQLRDQVSQTQADLEKAQAAQREASDREATTSMKNQDLHNRLADAERKAATAQGPSKDVNGNRDMEPPQPDHTNNSDIQVLEAKDAEIKRLEQQLSLASQGEHFAKMAWSKAEDEAKKLKEQLGQGSGEDNQSERRGSDAKPNDAAMDNRMPKLETETLDLRSQLSRCQQDLSASTQRESKSKEEINTLTEQVARVQQELADANTNPVTALESECHDLREQVGSIQAELTKAHEAEALATSSKCQAEEAVQRLQSQLAEVNKASDTQTTSNTEAKDVSSKLQSQLEGRNEEVIRLQADLTAARHAEQAAIQREATTKAGTESFLLAEAQKQKDADLAALTAEHTAEKDSALDTQAAKARADADNLRLDTEIELTALRKQLREASMAQKTAEDEAARLRAAANEQKINPADPIGATSAGASTSTGISEDALLKTNDEISKLHSEVDKLKVKLDSRTECKCANVPANAFVKESKPESEPSLTLLKGQLQLAKAMLKSSEDAKNCLMAETVRLKDEVTTYKRFELNVADVVSEGQKIIETLEADLRKTRKKLRKYTGDMKKLEVQPIDADAKAPQPKKKASHLRIQTSQLAAIHEKDRQIEKLKLQAGWDKTNFTSTIVAQKDEIKILRAAMKLADHTSKTCDGQSAASVPEPEQWSRYMRPNAAVGLTDPPAPYSHHILSREAQTLLDTEITQSRQAFEQSRRQRTEAFEQFQITQDGLSNRDDAWHALEQDTHNDQQYLREDFQLKKEDLIRKTRLAEDWLYTGLGKQGKVETEQIDRKETLAEARAGKQRMQATMDDSEDL